MHTAIILANLALQKLICPAQEQLQTSLDLLNTSFQVKGFFFVFVDHPPEHMCHPQMQQEKQIARHRQEEAVGITASIWLTCFSRLQQNLSQMLHARIPSLAASRELKTGRRAPRRLCDLASTIMQERLAAYQRIHHVQCSCEASWRKDSGP